MADASKTDAVSQEPQPLATWYLVLVCALLGVVLIALLCGRNRIALATFLVAIIVQFFGLAFIQPRQPGAQVCVAGTEPAAFPSPLMATRVPTRTPKAAAEQPRLSFLDTWKRKRKRFVPRGSSPPVKTKQMQAISKWWTERAQDPQPHLRRYTPPRAMTLEEHTAQVAARKEREQRRRTRRAEREHPGLRKFEEDKEAWHNAQLTRALIEPGLPMSEQDRSALHRRSMAKQRHAVRGPASYIGRITAAAQRRVDARNARRL